MHTELVLICVFFISCFSCICTMACSKQAAVPGGGGGYRGGGGGGGGSDVAKQICQWLMTALLGLQIVFKQ